MISSQVSEKQELTPRESIDESRFEAGFCEFHGWFTAGIKSTDGTGSRWFAGCPRCLAETKIKKLFGQSSALRTRTSRLMKRLKKVNIKPLKAAWISLKS